MLSRVSSNRILNVKLSYVDIYYSEVVTKYGISNQIFAEGKATDFKFIAERATKVEPYERDTLHILKELSSK